MTFAHPALLWLLALVPLVALLLAWSARRRRAALARLAPPSLLARLAQRVDPTARRWRAWLWLAAFALVIVAVARPQWGRAEQRVEQRGVQLMVALDVSASMLAQDVRPSRLERAKLEIVDLMTQLRGDQVGLVPFSGAAFVQVPLTNDYSTTRSFLDAAGPNVISRPGTVIGEAVRVAMTGFDEHRAGQKVIVLFTDGEDHETEPLAAAEEAAEAGIVIYTVGLGSPEGEPVPLYNERGQRVGVKRDAAGQVVISRLDEETLRAMAEASGGRYLSAEERNPAAALAEELEALEQGTSVRQLETKRVERFQLFLLPAVLLLLAAELVPNRLSSAAPVPNRPSSAAPPASRAASARPEVT